MIFDKELELATGVALDLGAKRSGPGKFIKVVALGVTLDVVVTTGATNAAADPLITVECGGADLVEFDLPSSTLQWISAVFADGEVKIMLEGAQTNT